MVKILVDHRERSSGIFKELIKEELNVEITNLAIADFVIQGKTSEGKLQNIGIERKTQHDFINSIIDKRIITQLSVLKENFDFPLLIIEGDENIYKIRNFHPNAIRGMLSVIALEFQIPILHTKNYRDTAALLAVIARRLEKTKRDITLLKKRKPLTLKEQQELIIESLPGIGPTIAKNLLKEFGNIKKIVNAKPERLQKVDKIGKKKAETIRNIIEEIYKS